MTGRNYNKLPGHKREKEMSEYRRKDVVALIAMMALIAVGMVWLIIELGEAQIEAGSLQKRLDEIRGMTERAFEREDMMASEWVQCRVQVETWEKRWQRYEMHASMAEWMCACLGPPATENDIECIALTAERNKLFEEWERQWDEEAAERDKRMREEGRGYD